MKSFIRMIGLLAGWTLGIFFILILTTGRTYAAEYIYYTQSYAPYQVKMAERSDPSDASVIYTSPTGSPYAVAVDETARCIYLSDPHGTVSKIFKAGLDGSDFTPLIEGVHAQGLAVNQENGDLYYAEPDTGTVYKAARGSFGGTIIYSSVGAPRAVAVDPEGNGGAGYLYIADYNLGKIIRTGLDGSDPQTFLDGVHVTGLAIDQENGTLYFAVAYDPDFYVARVKLSDGQGKEILYTSATGSPRALAVNNSSGSVYFSDWHSTVAKVFRANLTGEIGLTEVISSVNAYGLAVVTDLPVITAVSPSYGLEAGGIAVTITGRGFTGATAVNFGTIPGTSLKVVSDTEITVSAPAGTGTVAVSVVSPGGSSEATETARFTYTLPKAADPSVSVLTNEGYIKKNAAITLSSETGATIYYTAAVNAEPGEPTTETPTYVSNGGAVTLPELTYGDVLNIKAAAIISGKLLSGTKLFSYTVQPKTSLTLTGITVENKEYDGTTSAAGDFTGAALSGILGADAVTLAGTPGASFADSFAGDAKEVTITGYSLTGDDAEYYTLNQTVENVAKIFKKNLTLGSVVVADKEYDGSASAQVTEIEIASGIIAPDDVSVDVSLAAALFDDGAAVGAGKAVTVNNILLKGGDKDNYNISSSTAATATITKKTVSIESVTIADKPYDGTTDASISAALIDEKVGSEDVFLDWSTASAAFHDETIGTGKPVAVTGLKLGGTEHENYQLSSDSFAASGNITPLGTIADPAADPVSGTEIKSGTEITLTVSEHPSAVIYYTVGTVQSDPTDASSSVASGGKVTVGGNPGDTFVLSAYGSQTGYHDSSIVRFTYHFQTAQTLIVAGANALSKDYDGTRNAEISGGTLTGTILPGDEVALDCSAAYGIFADKNAGTNKPVDVGGYALTGADSGYYGLQLPDLSADIQVRNVSAAAIDIQDKVFDETTSAAITGIALSWKADDDDVFVDFSSASAAFADAGVGRGKRVVVTGLILTGRDASNYYLISADTYAFGNIIATGTVTAPHAEPLDENVLSGTAITLSGSTDGADIYYTTDGGIPTTASDRYTAPITLNGTPGDTVIVKAIAVKQGMSDSGIMQKEYRIIAPPVPPNEPTRNGKGSSKKNTEPVIRIEKSENTVNAIATTIAVTGSEGKSSTSVTDQLFRLAVEKAMREAEIEGTEMNAVIAFQVEAPESSRSIVTGIPAAAVRQAAAENVGGLSILTPIATVTFDAETISEIAEKAKAEINITTARVEASSLPDEVSETVGNRPVYDFTVESGNRTISEFGGRAEVSIPYTPTAAELQNPEAIVVYYINDKGELETVANGHYNPATKHVVFTTDHFSRYAVGYHQVRFNDVKTNAWYKDAVSFIAARDITDGTGNGRFSPDAKLTRGQFLVMLLKAYGIEPGSTSAGENFSDAGNTWYTGYLAAAKDLNLSSGVGNNRFAPEKQITRQELFTLTYNVLKSMDKLPEGTSEKTIINFSDSGEISSWAELAMARFVESGAIEGSGGKLSPADATTRAQMAKFISNMLTR